MSSKLLTDFSYWIGIVQTDGHFAKYSDGNKERYRVTMYVGPKSLEMLNMFKSISKDVLDRRTGIWKVKNRESYYARISIKKYWKLFQGMNIIFGDPPVPPEWIKLREPYFGAYLAGVIDGDGSVLIRRPKYPQLVIRICSGGYPEDLASLIKEVFKCGVNVTKHEADRIIEGRVIHGKWYILEFVVSSKCIASFEESVLPYLSISHKREKAEQFIRLYKNSHFITSL